MLIWPLRFWDKESKEFAICPELTSEVAAHHPLYIFSLSITKKNKVHVEFTKSSVCSVLVPKFTHVHLVTPAPAPGTQWKSQLTRLCREVPQPACPIPRSHRRSHPSKQLLPCTEDFLGGNSLEADPLPEIDQLIEASSPKD